MFCIKCGAQIADNSRFCNHCGFDQNAVPQEASVQQSAYQQPAYQQPVYQQPAYQQPAYQQPVYQQPVYQQPIYPQGAPMGSGVATAVKAAKGGASVVKWIIAAVLVIGVAAFVVIQFDLLNFFKSDEDLIRERVAAFEDAYNNTDWDSMMECLDGSSRAILETAMSFLDGMMSEAIGFDLSMSDLFEISGLMISGDFCQMEVIDIQINGDYAEVTVTMSVSLYDTADTETVVLPMVKEGGDWYISFADELSGLFGY